jgi:serum/glucocorticoid-regulated kinase 2
MTTAPYIPPIDPSNASDTQNFDDTFLDMEPVIDDGNDNEQTDTDQERAGGDQTDTDRTDPDATTPSQSRSSSVVRPASNDGVDVFDGYSFKGRHSVILDEDEDEESEGSDEEEGEEEELLMDDDVDVSSGPSADVTPEQEPTSLSPTLDEDANEPKTPEARPSAPLPDLSSSSEEDGLARPVPAEVDPSASSKDVQEVKTKPVPAAASPQKPPARTVVSRPARNRREKSGVPALDRYLSDTIDEDGEATEREEEDEDWDFVEAGDGEDRNGAKGTSLFARGVVDRYRLAVFRKGSTTPHRAAAQSPPGGSKEIEGAEDPISPTPSEKQRRGRNQGLTFRSPRQFLQPKPAPSTYSGKASARIGMSTATSGTLSASTASSGGLLTPSSTLPPSLKSKGSSTSVTMSSDNLGIIDQELIGPADHNVRRSRPRGEPEPRKPRKLRKYKEGAEKVFSLFAASPRQA